MINVNGRDIETDAEGYLQTLDDWSEDVRLIDKLVDNIDKITNECDKQ